MAGLTEPACTLMGILGFTNLHIVNDNEGVNRNTLRETNTEGRVFPRAGGGT